MSGRHDPTFACVTVTPVTQWHLKHHAQTLRTTFLKFSLSAHVIVVKAHYTSGPTHLTFREGATVLFCEVNFF